LSQRIELILAEQIGDEGLAAHVAGVGRVAQLGVAKAYPGFDLAIQAAQAMRSQPSMSDSLKGRLPHPAGQANR